MILSVIQVKYCCGTAFPRQVHVSWNHTRPFKHIIIFSPPAFRSSNDTLHVQYTVE